MLTVLILLTISLLVGLVVGLVGSGWLLLPRDRRRLAVIASELLAEAQIDAMTRSTLAAMRQVVRDDGDGRMTDIRRSSR